MAKTPRAGELKTANYGWTKPTVGASDDQWGGLINANLDGIDSTVHGIETSVTTSLGDYLPLTGGTLTGNLTLNQPLVLDIPTNNEIVGVANGDDVWAMKLGDPSNNFALNYWDSGGAYKLALTLDRTGTATFDGPIVLPADPVANLQAATKQYVDAVRMNDNRIINGNFAINQRTTVTNTALAAAAYGHDRWKAGAAGCTYTFTATAPDTTLTITAGTLTQIIEAGMIEGGAYTLSWTGTAQARVWQGTATGSYAASPLTTASLAVGTNTVVEFNAGTVTRVKLESGSVATPFNRQSLAKSLADCQRYFVGVGSGAYVQLAVQGYGVGAGYNTNIQWSAPVTMRAAPTISAAWGGGSNASAQAITALGDNRTIQSGITSVATGGYTATLSLAYLSAEL